MHNHQGFLCGNAKNKIKGATSAIITSSLFLLSHQPGKSEETQNSTWSYITEAKGETVEVKTGRFIYRSPIEEEKQHLKGAILETGSKVLVSSGPLLTNNQYWLGVRKGGWLKLDSNQKEITPGVWSLSDSEPFYSLKVEPISGSQEAVRLFPKAKLLLQSSSVLKQDDQTWVYFFVEGYLIASDGTKDFVSAPKLQKRPLEIAVIEPNDGEIEATREPEPIKQEFFLVEGDQANFHFHNGLIEMDGYDAIAQQNAVVIASDTDWGVNHPTIIIGSAYRNRPEIFSAAQKLVDHAAATQTAETGIPVTGKVKVSGYQEVWLDGQAFEPSGTRMDSVIQMKLYSVNYVENVRYWNSDNGLAKQWELVETFGESVGGEIYIFQPDEGLTEYDNHEVVIHKKTDKGESKTKFAHYQLDKNVFENPGSLTAMLTGSNPESFMGVTAQSHPQTWPLIQASIEQNKLTEAKQLAWDALARSAAAEGFYSDLPLVNEILVSAYHHRGSRGAQEVLALFLEQEATLSDLIKSFENRIMHNQGWEQQWVEARRTQEWHYHVPRIGVAEAEREKFRKGLEMRWATEAIYLSRASKQNGRLKRG